MKKIFFVTLFLILALFTNVSANEEYFNKGLNLFDKENYEKSKFFFEKDIVFNPKKTRSYLYLAKIYNLTEKVVEEEKNLNAVLLLEPINEEGAIMLIELKLKNSDFSKVNTLLNDFEKICKKLCYKTKEITKKLKIASAAKKN